jgi:hypothetical protein
MLPVLLSPCVTAINAFRPCPQEVDEEGGHRDNSGSDPAPWIPDSKKPWGYQGNEVE